MWGCRCVPGGRRGRDPGVGGSPGGSGGGGSLVLWFWARVVGFFGGLVCCWFFFFYRGAAEGKGPRNVAASLDVGACAMRESVPVGTGLGAGFWR